MKSLVWLGLAWGQIATPPMDSNCGELSAGTVHYCDNVNDLFRIDKLEGLAARATIGEAYRVSVGGFLQEEVPLGSVLVVKYTRDGQEWKEERDLCRVLYRHLGMVCPVGSRTIETSFNVTVPAKPGEYVVDVSAWTPDERHIFTFKYSGQLS